MTLKNPRSQLHVVYTYILLFYISAPASMCWYNICVVEDEV